MDIDRFLISLLMPTHLWFALSTLLTRMVRLLQSMNLHWHIIITQSLLWFTLSTVILWVRTNVWWHVSIIIVSLHSSFNALKILCTRFLSLPTQTLLSSNLFIVSIALPFPGCHVVGIIQSMIFSDWFLSLCNIRLRFLCTF